MTLTCLALPCLPPLQEPITGLQTATTARALADDFFAPLESIAVGLFELRYRIGIIT